MPDVRAWGKDKSKYYATDYVDPDYGGFQGNDATLAEIEEEEARNLQKQLVQQLDDDDFNLDIFTSVRIILNIWKALFELKLFLVRSWWQERNWRSYKNGYF